MRREDGLDIHREHQPPHLLQFQPLLLQLENRILDSPRLSGALVHILTTAANAVRLFGHVDHLEPCRECPHQITRARRGHTAHVHDQLYRGFSIALSLRDGRLPCAFDRLEQLFAALLANDIADQSAKHVHVFAQLHILDGEYEILTGHEERLRSLWMNAPLRSGRIGHEV